MSIAKTLKKAPATPKTKEKALEAFIKKPMLPEVAPENDFIKQMNIKIPNSVLERINLERQKIPKKLGAKRLAVSLNDWIIEAIREKLDRGDNEDLGHDGN